MTVLGWLAPALAASASTAAGDADRAAVPARPALLSDPAARDRDLADSLAGSVGTDAALWVTTEAGEQLLLLRPAQGSPRGNVLLLTDPGSGPAALRRSAMLHRGLARHGWHAFLGRLPVAGEPLPAGLLQALLDGVRANGGGSRTVVLVEGRLGHRLLPAIAEGTPAMDALVVLDLPWNAPELERSAKVLAGMALPTLLLQEYPRDWPRDLVLSAAVELQRLPAGYPGLEDDLTLRRLRGWLQRDAAG
ncbi:MAG: hypothetical protein R3E86_19510 [Pseudomonadales bacterium]